MANGEARPITEEEYWSQLWTSSEPPRPVDATDESLRNDYVRALCDLFDEFLGSLAPGSRVLELGCARSVWLPYLAKRYGLSVAGLDYSAVGCAQARAVLRSSGVVGEVYEADFFTPPSSLVEKYDVVFSMGLVEHFENTAHVFRAASAFVKPGGIVLTTVPNFVGLTGALAKVINRPNYDLHFPLDAEDLQKACRNAGLEVLGAGYLVSTDFGVLADDSRRAWTVWVRKVLVGLSMGVRFLGKRTPLRLKPSRWASPFAYCAGRKSAQYCCARDDSI